MIPTDWEDPAIVAVSPVSQYGCIDENERTFIGLGKVAHFMLFLSCFTVVALTGLTLLMKRALHVRRGRENFERREEAVRMVNRLQEAFDRDGLVNLTSDGVN